MNSHQEMLAKPQSNDANSHWHGSIALGVVTLLWGSTYAVIRDTVNSVAPSGVVFGRFLIAALLFIPFLKKDRRLIQDGFKLGFWLFLTYALQTISLQYTSANRCAFVHALNTILVPLLLTIRGKHLRWSVWCAALLALIGVGLLANDEALPNIGDGCAFLSAITYAFYLIVLDSRSRCYPPLSLTATQLTITALFAGGWMWFETQSPFLIVESESAWISLFYLALIATALTIWMQVWGHRFVVASEAAIIFTLEPFWAAVFGYLLLDETLCVSGWIGAGCILVALLLGPMQSIRAEMR